jgi:ASC-1-like (ASCH) protein
MLHKMKLKKAPFEKINEGRKTVELRLNDEKRQKVQVGDYIEFTLIDNSKQKMTVRVTALHNYDSFQHLYADIPKEKIGYGENDIVNPNHMDEFYSREEQEKYGVLGIEIRLTDLQKFIDAQENGYMLCSDYKTALAEIKNGRKNTHWIWYVFPQIAGLGQSGTTVQSTEEKTAGGRRVNLFYIHRQLPAHKIVMGCAGVEIPQRHDGIVTNFFRYVIAVIGR